jgi:hypothetical protein
MFSPQIEWNCAECGSVTTVRRKYCTEYDSMLTWTCTGSGKSGLYTNYYRHRDNCNYCTPDLKEERQKKWKKKKLIFNNIFSF